MTPKLRPKVLVVDDEVEVGRFFENFLREERRCRVTVANSGREARSKLCEGPFDLAFVDLRLPDATGAELLTEIKKAHPLCHVIIMTGYSTTKSAVDAIRLGAFDYVEKPFAELEQLEEIMDRAILSIASKGATSEQLGQVAANFNLVLSHDSPVKPVLEVAAKIAKKNLTVLIHGPTGAGKEVLARFIHANSRARRSPSSASTAAPSPRRSWKASSSATRGARLRGPSPCAAASSRWPTEEHSSWTKSGRPPRRFK